MHISKSVVKKMTIALLSVVLAVMLLFAFNTQNIGSAFAAASTSNKYFADFDSYEEEKEVARDLNEEFADESYVLMKNENNALPLKKSENRISLFATNSDTLIYGGSGSGGGNLDNPIYLEQGLQDAGFILNPRLLDIYAGAGNTAGEVPVEDLAPAEGSFAMYDGAAVIVISRTGSEFNDAEMWGVEGHSNPLDQYYSLTDNEKEIIDYAQKFFDKVIIVVNSAHPIELGDVNDDAEVDAIVWMGLPGVTGSAALGRILNGEVNPSGHTSDVYPRYFSQDPTWPNFKGNIQSQLYLNDAGELVIKDIYTGEEVAAPADTGFTSYEYLKYARVLDEDGNIVTMDGPSSGARYYNTLDYEEGIYMGYRWYETAYAEIEAGNYLPGTDADTWYDDNVVYPFGYGLSYTTFDWEIVSDNIPSTAFTPAGDGTNGDYLEMEIKVTNTGTVAGKDVAEIYFSAPYTKGGIEKSAVTLVEFAKSDLLQPGESQTIKISFRYQDMASFDYNDANDNDFQGYELEAGTYTVGVYEDSHTVATSNNGRTPATVQFRIATDKRYTKDSTTDAEITTLFTPDKGDTEWDGTRSDGQWYDSVRSEFVSPESPMTILSRADFEGTYPEAPTKEDLMWSDEAILIMDNQVYYTSFNDMPSDPWYVSEEDIPDSWTQAGEDDVAARVNGKTAIQLYEMAGVPFEDEKWDTFMNQLTYDEMRSLITSNRFSTPALEAIGKDRSTDQDGPAQLASGTFWVCEVNIASTWNTDLAYIQGRLVGNESLFQGVNGWYGPGMNIHRNPAAGRNFEYYSQDGLHSGKIAAAVIKGATDMGVVVYMKHLFMNDQETNRYTSATFATEQAIREIYAKPWELAIKEGNANASMAAFNRVGLLDTTSHYNLYEGLLKNEFGFKGSSVTDMFGWGYCPGDSGDMGARTGITPLGTWNDTFGRNVEGVWDDEKQTVVCTFTEDITNGTKWTKDDATGTESVAMSATNPGDYNTINRGGSAAYKGATSLLDHDGLTLYKEGDTIESYTQWAAVRIEAQRLLWAQCNGNNSKNGVDLSGFADNDALTAVMGSDCSTNIAPADSGATLTAYDVTSGALPAGLTIGSDGTITGRATESGTFNFTVTMTADTFVTATADFTMTVESAFDLSAASIEVNSAYSGGVTSDSISTSSGYSSVAYALDSGALPTGLTLNADGTITGTATETGTYNFTVRVDTSRRSGRTTINESFYEDFTIAVTAASGPSEIDQLKEQLDAINSQLDALETQVGAIDADELQSAIDALESAKADIESQIAALEGDVAALQTEEGGCGSVIGASSAVLGGLILVAGTVIVAKKRNK